MSEPCRKFSHRSQTVALLFHPSGFANSVGHEANQTLRQFRHLLHKLGEERRWETKDLCVRRRSGIQWKLLHSRKGQNAGHVARLGREHHSFAPELAACLELSFEDDKHCVGRIALAEGGISLFEVQLFRMAEEPIDLVLR